MADQEYLQNIAGSPHIDEGLGDRIFSRGSSALQRLGSVAGGSFADPNYTKVESLFNTFLKKIIPVLKDFSEGPHSVANRLGQMRPGLTPQHESEIQKLQGLYDLLVPSQFRQHQVANSVLAPRNRSQLGELLKEGLFTRDMALNKALYSNDPKKIIDAYTNKIKGAYDTFITDAMKVTGAPKDYIKRVVSNLNTKWANVINKVEQSVGPSVPAPSAPTTPPPTLAAPPTAPSPADATATAKPENEPLQAKSAEDDFVVLTSNVIDILIEAVKGDEKLAAAFFKPSKDGGPGLDPLPQNWNEPSITKEADEPEPAAEKDASDPTGDVEDDASGENHEFLYNFHSLYRKQRNFAIDVPIHDKSKATFVNRRSKTTSDIQVTWSNASHENSIYVKYTPRGEKKNEPATKSKGGQILLFKFWDNQVNPRNPESNKFSIKTLLTQANQGADKLIAGANPELIASTEKKTDQLQRSLYATVSRKRMEFKPKPFQLTHDDDGNVFRVKRDGTTVAVSKEELKAHLTSKDASERERWTSSLEKIGYFKKFPMDSTPKEEITIDKIPAAMDAVKALGTLGHKSIASMKAVQSAVDELGPKASTEEYLKLALSKASGVTATTSTSSTPVSAPVSAPVTAPVSAPVSAPVTAPVSTEKPTPEKAPSKPGKQELGKATFDDTGVITWEKPNGKTVKMTPKQLKNMKSPRLELLLTKMGYFKKFPAAMKEWLDEETVNPFDPANLL